MTAERRRPWWLAWTDPRLARFYAVTATVLVAFFTVVWIPGLGLFAAAVYVMVVLAGVYSWWAVWYLATRWTR